MSKTDVEVAVYYFPQYHPDARNDVWHGKGWTEWELMKCAKPRFEGHRQPVVPAWGYFDESDPAWTAQEIDLAADHGITAFIYDWYWWEDGPFLQDGLERGFLGAMNCERMKFALMWANHDWINIHPSGPVYPTDVRGRGEVSREAFERLTDHAICEYFCKPNYWRIDGKPYFSIYESETFIRGLGGVDAAREALEDFRERVRKAGHPGLHLNVTSRGFPLLRGESAVDLPQTIEALGLDSVTSYTWVHHYNIQLDGFPHGNYKNAAAANYAIWEEHLQKLDVPYHPNVSMGWDSSPRTIQSDVYECRNYPWCTVLSDNTPDAFRESLEKAKSFVMRPEVKQKIITINAWNEWTEGSYLLPDTDYGTAYLEAIKDTFGNG